MPDVHAMQSEQTRADFLFIFYVFYQILEIMLCADRADIYPHA